MPAQQGYDKRYILYYLLPALLALSLIGDVNSPLGRAIWVTYLIPTVLAFLAVHRITPLAVALAGIVLSIVGLTYAPAGVDPTLSMFNRAVAAIANLTIAGIGMVFITYRIANRRLASLREAEVALAKATAGDLTLPQVGQATLACLAERFGASVGAIYVRDSGIFRRAATYGVPEGAAIPAELSENDGLLGEAIRTGKGRVVEDVPTGYLAFGTALGSASPRTLVIGTTANDEVVNSVIELGFLHKQSRADEAVEFLKLTSSALAVTLRSAKYRARLQALLAETQQQAEELQTQSEELQATNDELEAQSKLLLASQAQLEDQQAELEQNNAQLEEQTISLEAQRDELTRAQASLKAQASELEQASRYKSEFLANMSHELRTPLNSLLIMARLLADNRPGTLNEEQIRFAETIETSGNDLLTLINDVLDISKIEAGRLELEPRAVTIDSITRKLQADFAPFAEKKGLTLRIAKAADVPVEFETDSLRLEQVLRNFLSNAIKFTERGEVAVEVASAASDRIRFTVRDSGPGIDPEQHGAIFEAFRQADGGIARKFGGTGLGLSIARELAQLLGGEIRLDSEPGKGSAFSVELPLRFQPGHTATPGGLEAAIRRTAPSPTPSPAPARQRPAAAVPDDRETLTGDSRLILVVEDDPAFARILYDLAHELGFKCLIAGTADEGALLARQYVPHAVILDMHLPDHTGLSVLDRIKRDTRTRHIPVHVVSADEDNRAALESGAVGYLFKPVSRDSLMDMLEGLETRMDQRLRRVLVIEDDPKQAESIHHLLASRDVETVEVHTGAECLSKLSSETFDCMVLDLNLPDMPGLDLLERLSGDESLGFPPVIVYTGRDLSSEEEMRLRRYSKSIIVKGAKSPERLLDEVTLFLHQVVSELPAEQQKLLAKSLGRDAALEGRQVLVVEDDIRNVYALTSVLEPHGVQVRIARNGLEALSELARAADGDGRPVDLVLMDVMMPEMDGLTCMREIRKDQQWSALPIIALTAKAMERDHQECLEAGANDYLAKPLDVDKLLSLVRVWMPR
ncbi:CheY-like chemotaxis protein/signal transduction histidine kinase [Novosphingobium chloroacetimidivorans]|uniref:histidine kinase n=1 Tax=Novosphingobium chloroacetimidivorans TaxID=1428314 RepID=A0A7W7K691_9SPHN|nr:response regulator [Novosphingobium chloroacetimidivorans]MBB4856931.1 CheY-like chemotaxis protein/signal transduction histidine kinase [Novosphingobium chloroacetimidivorans]